MGNAVLQSLDLRIYAHLCSRQSWYTHLHLDILHAALFLGSGSHLLHLANGGFGEVLNTHFGNQSVHNFFLNRCWFHILVISFILQRYEKRRKCKRKSHVSFAFPIKSLIIP